MLKNLSAYGWISVFITGILCAIFMGIASNGPEFLTFFASVSSSSIDDDDQGRKN